MRLRFGIGLTMVLVLGVALIGCGGGSFSSSTTPPTNPTPSLKSLSVSGPTTAYSGQTGLQYKAMGTYSDGSTKDLTSSATWSSSVSVVTINSSGLATAVAASQGGVALGALAQKVTIKATSGSIVGSNLLTVSDGLASIAVTPSAPTITASTTETFTATGTFQDGSSQQINSSVTWKASPISVATINASGVATGVATGQAAISAECPCTLQLAPNENPLATTSLNVTAGGAGGLVSITVTATSSSTLVLTAPFDQLTATGNYLNGPSQNLTNTVTWSVSSSSGGGAANVNYGGTPGLIEGTHSGTVTIQAQLGTITGSSAPLTATAVLNSMTASPIGPAMLVGGTQQFTATGTYNDGTTGDVTAAASWSSLATNIVAFSGGGLATGGTQGATTITATIQNATKNNIQASTAVNVVNAPTSSANLADGGYAFTLLAANSTGPVFYAGSFDVAESNSGNACVPNPNSAVVCGNITNGLVDVNVAGTNPAFFGNLTGSYTVYPDGRGLLTFNRNAIFDTPGGITLRFILSQNGTMGKLMEFDGRGNMSGSLWQQQAPVTGMLNGNYVFRATGIDSLNQPMGEVGMFNADGITTINNGWEDIDDYGKVSPLVGLGSSSFTTPVQGGRGTLTLSSGTTTTNYAYYVVNASSGGFPNLVNFIETDNAPGTALAGTIQLQTALTYVPATLRNGGAGYEFLFDRPVVVGNYGSKSRTEFGQVGEYTFDGVSVVTGIRDDSNVQPPLANPITIGTGGYNVSTSGINGRGTITTTAADSARGYTFYMVSQNDAFALQTYTGYQTLAGSLNAPIGEMHAQAGNFTLSTLTGEYAMDASDLVSRGHTTELMWLDFDGSGAINGIMDASTGSPGTNATALNSAVISTSYTGPAATSGRAALNLTSTGRNDFVMYLISSQGASILNVNPTMDGSLNLQ